jgi:NADPH:quinone reductase-like Zn-dependent oxidoreductase
VNAAPQGEAAALGSVADGGRFATITGRPPGQQRGVSIADVFVRADGPQLRKLAGLPGEGRLSITVASSYTLEQAPAALQSAIAGAGGGAVVIRP